MKGFTKHFVSVLSNKNFFIWHNLPDTPGLSIEDAFENWVALTHRYSAKSFVSYINSKFKGYKAYTEEEYKQLSK